MNYTTFVFTLSGVVIGMYTVTFLHDIVNYIINIKESATMNRKKFESIPESERMNLLYWLHENTRTSKYDIYVTYADGTSSSIHTESEVPVMAELLKEMNAYGVTKSVTIEEIAKYIKRRETK